MDTFRSVHSVDTLICLFSNTIIAVLLFAKGSLNGGLEPTVSVGQQQRETDADISFKVRAWLTLAILSSELLLAFNITMVSQPGLPVYLLVVEIDKVVQTVLSILHSVCHA